MLFRQPPWPPQAVSSTEATVWNEIEAITDDDILPYSVTESRRLIHVTNLLKKAAERFRQVEHYLSEYREVAATGFFQHYDEGDDLRRCAFLVEYGRKYQRVFDLLEIADEKLEVALNTPLGVLTLPRRIQKWLLMRP